MNRLLKFILPTVAILLIFGVLLINKSNNDIFEENIIAPELQYNLLNLNPDVEYVGDEECVLCHSEIFNTFKQTGMGRSFYPPSKESIIEDYIQNNHVFDQKSNLHYQMVLKEGEFFQMEYRLDEKGQRVHELARKVDYIIGSGNHGRTYLTRENGFLYEMPVTWYSDKGIWDLSPGYRSTNYRFSRPIVQGCMNCHNSYADYIQYSGNRYSDVPHGIGCERCHGPGELHIEKRYNVKFAKSENEVIDSTIVNPKHLSLELQIDVCRQCHLQGEIRVLKDGRKDTDFRPGMRLNDVKSVYISDKLSSGDFRVASHGARISLSVCFLKSGGKLVCTTCHNPHEPVQWLSRNFFNEKCLTCHEMATLSPTNQTADHEPSGDCVACHMRQGATSDILHVNFTDHWIRKEIKTLLKADVDSLRRHNESNALVLKDFFEEKDSAAEIRLGIAYLQYFEEAQRPRKYLDHAISLLTSGLRSNTRHESGLYNLGKAYLHLDRLNEALLQFQKLVNFAPKNALAYLLLGQVLNSLGRLDEAVDVFRTSLNIFSENAIALTNLGNVYSQLGKPTMALNSYKNAMKVQPAYVLAHDSVGELYAYTLQDIETASKHFRKALDLDPDYVRALHNLGNINMSTGSDIKAMKYFERVIEIDPRFAAAYGNLAIIHFLLGQNEEAIRYLRKVLEINPQDVGAKSMLKQLGVPNGAY